MPIRQLLIVLSLCALGGLTSCGGGGGGGDGHPGFPTTQANLTAANAATFARFADLAVRAGATMRLGEVLNNTAPNTFTDGGCFSQGSSPATISLNGSTGAVNGTVSYTNFDRCFGMRLGGTSNVSGTMLVGNIFDPINYNFTTLSFTAGSQTIQASGTATLDWTSGGGTSSYLMTLNATASGAASFRVDGFQISSQLAAGLENVAITGRLTTSDGFVDITPGAINPQLVQVTSGLQGGEIIMTGATTRATVVYTGGGNSTITITPR